jgi:hypothetical protein
MSLLRRRSLFRVAGWLAGCFAAFWAVRRETSSRSARRAAVSKSGKSRVGPRVVGLDERAIGPATDLAG